MNGEIKTDLKLTDESWRGKMYGLVQDGRKFKVSHRALKATAWITAAAITVFQLFIAFQPSFRKSTVVMFAPPLMRSEVESIYVPSPMNSEKEAEKERQRQTVNARGRLVPIIDRIKPVNLSGLEGIPTGSEVIAQLVSGGANGMVKAKLVDALIASGEVLLPRGTVLMGKGSSSEDRLYIKFGKAITPDRHEMKISALAYDEKDRIVGLKGQKISNTAFKLAASAGLIFLGGVADGMREDYSSNPYGQRRPTMRDAALNGVSTSASDLSRETMESMKNSQARVIVDHSTRLIIIFGDSDATD